MSAQAGKQGHQSGIIKSPVPDQHASSTKHGEEKKVKLADPNVPEKPSHHNLTSPKASINNEHHDAHNNHKNSAPTVEYNNLLSHNISQNGHHHGKFES